MTFTEVLENPKGKEIIEQIEELTGEKEKHLVKIKSGLIKELYEKFNYKYSERR